MNKLHENLKIAFDARQKGLVPIPIVEGTKIPAVKWKPWQTAVPSVQLLREWFSTTRNIAIICTGMVVFDCDDPEKADLVLRECGDTPHKIRTPSGGIHLGYRRRKGVILANQVKIKGMAIDIRTDGGLELIPTSHTSEGRYEWMCEGLLPVSELPLARIAWTRERVRCPAKPTAFDPTITQATHGRILNPEAYCMRIQSIQGQNGSRGLVRAVCVLRDAKRTPEQALRFLLGCWNDACANPPWSEREILHAIRRHYRIA
jgi:hypothetical protein